MQRTVMAAVVIASLGFGRAASAQGCPPAGAAAEKCEGVIAKAAGKLVSAVITCHVKQADAAFKGAPIDDEPCESSDPAKSALAKFQKAIAKQLPACPPEAVSATQAAVAALLTSLDDQNGSIYCDPQSGQPIDPAGDDPGFVPASSAGAKCADGVAKAAAKLAPALLGCRAKALDQAFKGKSFDDSGCVAKAAKAFAASGGKLLKGDGCPPCLDLAHQAEVGDAMSAQSAALAAAIFPCPTTTTTTTTTITSMSATTTSTTASTAPPTTTTTQPSAHVCSPNGIIEATATLVPASDGSTRSTIAGIKVSLPYPGSVTLPGSGLLSVEDPSDPATRELLLDFALYSGLVIFNDTDAALVTTVATPSMQPITLSGPYGFVLARFGCAPSAPISEDGFSCAVVDESDPLGTVPAAQRPACQVTFAP